LTYRGLQGFVVKSIYYDHWKNNYAPSALLSHDRVRHFYLECGREAGELVKKLRKEFTAIAKAYPQTPAEEIKETGSVSPVGRGLISLTQIYGR